MASKPDKDSGKASADGRSRDRTDGRDLLPGTSRPAAGGGAAAPTPPAPAEPLVGPSQAPRTEPAPEGPLVTAPVKMVRTTSVQNMARAVETLEAEAAARGKRTGLHWLAWLAGILAIVLSALALHLGR